LGVTTLYSSQRHKLHNARLTVDKISLTDIKSVWISHPSRKSSFRWRIEVGIQSHESTIAAFHPAAVTLDHQSRFWTTAKLCIHRLGVSTATLDLGQKLVLLVRTKIHPAVARSWNVMAAGDRKQYQVSPVRQR
jgi:hypothetical protein